MTEERMVEEIKAYMRTRTGVCMETMISDLVPFDSTTLLSFFISWHSLIMSGQVKMLPLPTANRWIYRDGPGKGDSF